MGLYDEAVDTLYRATWDYAYHSAAYLELARISSLKGDLQKALNQINESLSTNSRNNSSMELKSSILRRLGNYKEAMEALAGLPENDPLDFRAENEKYLILKESGDTQGAEKPLADLKLKMRDFDQNYLELGIAYLNDGLTDEAEEVFRRFTGKNPLVCYYLGFIQDKKGNKTEATKLFKDGSDMSVDYVFPFRLETAKVLKLASEYHADDAKPWYYLGNLLYDKQPGKAIEAWENAVRLDPSLAIAHRNLGWGYYHHQGDGLKAIASYEKALSLKKDEPVYYEELDALYEMSNAPVEKRLTLFEESNDIVSKRDDAFARQITVLTLAGKPEKSVEYLTGRKFNYREGSSRVRDIIIDAHLMLGKKYFGEKKYNKALEEFLLAQVPEEEAGESRSGNRNLQVDYFIGMAYDALGNRSKAKKYYALSTVQESGNSSFIKYFQGLSWLKLGKKTDAADAFNALITEGEREIKQSSSGEVDFFAMFGTKEAENARLSNAYLLKGLGYKGLGNTTAAKDNLQKAVELSASNLYAITELSAL
jgi:tetratricopeptide (TPR) repeat protein